jgi:hypothetical protein
MNERKEGARYRYPESFVKLLAVVHAYVLPYRQLEGFMRALSQHVDGLKALDYTTIWWRVAKMKVDMVSSVELDKDVTIAVDSTGIKVSNRGASGSAKMESQTRLHKSAHSSRYQDQTDTGY